MRRIQWRDWPDILSLVEEIWFSHDPFGQNPERDKLTIGRISLFAISDECIKKKET